jgi:hypothetical protein
LKIAQGAGVRTSILAALSALVLALPCLAQERNPQVVMATSLGKVRLELFADTAPVSVKNFLQYVDEKYYDGLVFHRVIPSFMVQGGGLGKDIIGHPFGWWHPGPSARSSTFGRCTRTGRGHRRS